MQVSKSFPGYLELNGTPRLLVGSGEHYGALLNIDFNYRTYFATLAGYGLNQTRVFAGTYREAPGHFNIASNTLAPAPGRFISPWIETNDGRFDLNRFNPAYFDRLHDLMEHAERAGVVVELTLFCFWYSDDHWRLSPMHPQRNTAGIGPEDRDLVFTVGGNPLFAYQEALVDRLAAELAPYDNLILEVCNEPYSRHDHTEYAEWQHAIAERIARAEASPARRHLIAINYQNRARVLRSIHPDVSIINFHYALPEAVYANRHFGLPIGDDETGFQGQAAEPYRREAWNFLFAGGAAFSHLDYGFSVEHPDGSAPIEGRTPGYGGDDLRRQLVFLRRFLEAEEVWRLERANQIFAQTSNALPGQALADPGRKYLCYLPHVSPGMALALWIPEGRYTVEWINPVKPGPAWTEDVETRGRLHRLRMPPWEHDACVVLRRG